MWIYDLTIFSKPFYDNVLLAYRNNRLHRVETPPRNKSFGFLMVGLINFELPCRQRMRSSIHQPFSRLI